MEHGKLVRVMIAAALLAAGCSSDDDSPTAPASDVDSYIENLPAWSTLQFDLGEDTMSAFVDWTIATSSSVSLAGTACLARTCRTSSGTRTSMKSLTTTVICANPPRRS